MTSRSLTVVAVPGPGAEDVLLAPDGTVYTGTADGAIHAIADGDGPVTTVANTGGRPLGLEWLPDGRLLVCDAHRGLLAVDLADGRVDVLLTTVGGRPMMLCNNAAVTGDGTIYVSDSSTRWPVERWQNDLVEDTCTGRLLRLREGAEPEVLLDGLSFANGVALSADESFVTVAEAGHRTLRRVWLAGPKAGTDDVFVDDLPCHPDNIARGTDDLIWVTCASPKDPALTILQSAPRWARGLVRRLPDRVKPSPRRTARVAAYDTDGRLVHDIACDATGWHMATGVREHHGRVWLGSLAEPAVAWFAL